MWMIFVYTLHRFGSNSQKIWLDALYSCTSNDSCLTSCQRCPMSENHNCYHKYNDITLECGM